MTVAIALLLRPPAGPIHTKAYELVAVSAPVLWVPLVPFVPLQPPEAVHEAALVEFHVRIDVPPLTTVVGLADKATVGAGTTVTVVVAAALEPPAPVQVSEYIVLAVSGPVLWLPLVASRPAQPPDAVHAVALVELHDSVELPPTVMRDGLVVRVTVAAGATATMAVAVLWPPAPVQVSEYEAVAASAPVL